MTKPNPKNFIRDFLEYVKNKPFYVLNYNGEPNLNHNIKGNEIGGFYYVGETMDFLFNPKSIVKIYFFYKDIYEKKETTYWVGDVIENFKEGRWILVDWYNHNITYQNVEQHFSSIKNFDPFDRLNESEELEWAEDAVNYDVYKWGDVKSYLNSGDIISVTGNLHDNDGEIVIVLNNEPFIVKKGSETGLKWLNDLDKRPEYWRLVTDLDNDWIVMSSYTKKWDDRLDIRILKKNETPF